MNRRTAVADSRLTTAQAAEIRKVSRGRIYALYRQGRLKGKKIGGVLTFREADVASLKLKAVGRPRKPK